MCFCDMCVYIYMHMHMYVWYTEVCVSSMWVYVYTCVLIGLGCCNKINQRLNGLFNIPFSTFWSLKRPRCQQILCLLKSCYRVAYFYLTVSSYVRERILVSSFSRRTLISSWVPHPYDSL